MTAFADTATTESTIEIFSLEQLVAPGEVAARPLLPSLRYHPTAGELNDSDIGLPWVAADPGDVAPVVIGELARELGSRVPGRLVSSAKSWLSHAGVDRAAPILPWGAAESVPKVSPLHASAGYLAHVRAAWDHRFPRQPLEKQDLVLTVPASFDEAARSLTVEAARLAGLPRARLLEEPQAACYDWLHRPRGELAAALADTRLLLVCDVGGGTTDLTLIRVETGEDGPRLTRIGVGDHLMLGGDNMDLALAHVVEQRLGTERLSATGLSHLLQQCRAAKERLLAADAPAKTTVTVLGAGARLIGGARSAELLRDEARVLLVDGFLPLVDSADRPRGRRAGIVEFGLPYAADPAISRHIAAFLGYHADVARAALGERAPTMEGAPPMPDAVLLNGGVFHSAALTERLINLLSIWRGTPVTRLLNDQPDLAVARGAVAYGLARRGRGLRIGGGSARSYFLAVGAKESAQAVCLLPRGSEEGQEIRLAERSFSLRLGDPVRFHLVSSIADTVYRPGQLVDLADGGFAPLPPIATVVGDAGDSGEETVHLTAQLTEVGTLETRCVAARDPTRSWRLAFELRGAEETPWVHSSHPRFAEAAGRIERLYGTRAKDILPKEIKNLRADLEQILGKRESWDSALARALFGTLWEGARRRRRSADHERLWFSLAGYCLRPGFGYPLDDWRMRQVWTLYAQGVQYVNDPQNWSEWWTLWRRVAGGLDEQAQTALLDAVAPDLRAESVKSGKDTKRKPGYEDKVRLVAALELVSSARKVEAGNGLLNRLEGKGESPQTWWAVGRLGARVPFYGSAHNAVSRAIATEWVERALRVDWKQVQPAAFAATLLARLSGDRERDLDPAVRTRVVQQLRLAKAPTSWIRLVEEVVELDAADEKQVFGESLPPGLRLMD